MLNHSNKEMTFGGNYMGKCQHMIPNGIKEEDCPVCRPSPEVFTPEQTGGFILACRGVAPEVDEKGILSENKIGELWRDTYSTHPCFMPLQWVEKILSAQQAYDRQAMQGPSLEEVRQLLKLCEDILEAAEHGDYSNSNVSHGMDEGQVGFYHIFQEYKAKLQELTNLFAKYPKSEAKKGDTNVNR